MEKKTKIKKLIKTIYAICFMGFGGSILIYNLFTDVASRNELLHLPMQILGIIFVLIVGFFTLLLKLIPLALVVLGIMIVYFIVSYFSNLSKKLDSIKDELERQNLK